MKILLDENIDVRFKLCFPEMYKVYTVKDMGWTGIKNGKLLQLLDENKFDCWIVVDKNIPYQQNLTSISCFVIVLDVLRNTLTPIKTLLPKILNVLEKGMPEKVQIISEDK